MTYTDGLETARLITRFVTLADTSAWLEYCSDPEATRFTAIWGKQPAELAEHFINTTLKRYAEGRLGLQALINKETGEFVGQCGLLLQIVNGNEEVEIGYHLRRRHWHKGYAIEAATAFRDYGFRNYPVTSLVSLIDADNAASQSVAMRNGMRLSEKDADLRGEKIDIYRIMRSEWEAL